MKRPAGFTLVEMLIALGACTAILSISIGLVHRAMHFHSDSLDRIELQRNLIRFSRQLRSDLADAHAINVDGQQLSLRRQGRDQETTTYQFKPNLILRQHVMESSPPHHEQYNFKNCLSDVVVHDDERVNCTITHHAPEYGINDHILLHVEASLRANATQLRGIAE